MTTQTLSTRTASSEHHATQLGWGLLLLFGCVFGGLYWAGQAALLQFAYPLAAFFVAAWLYLTQPVLYVGLALWMWMITPFVRRVLDYQMGEYTSLSLAMTAPLAVGGLALFTMARYGRRLLRRQNLPFALAAVGILYGYGIGVLQNGPVSATMSMLGWLLPLALAFHMVVYWKHYPAYRQVIQSSFVWMMLVTGAYGIVQFLYPPPWDALWMEGSGMLSIGQPAPFEVRVFSTLNSPGPYAMVALAGLVMLFAKRGGLARLATGAGAGGLLLSLVRSAWGGWIVALGYMIVQSTGALRKRLIAILTVSAIVCLPLFFVSPIAERVGDRTETLTQLEDDSSMLVRLHFLGVAARWVLTDPIGSGLGSVGSSAKMSRGEQHMAFDNGFLSVLFTLGWLGGGLFYAGVGMLLYRMIRIDRSQADPSTVVFSAVAVSFVAVLFFTNVFAGVMGLMFWTGLSLTLASGRYHAAAPAS